MSIDNCTVQNADELFKIKQYIQAHKCYESLAQVGNDEAQWKLATLYLNGLGCEKNENKFLEWTKKSIEKNNAQAYCNLGKYYIYKQEYTLAIANLEKASSLNLDEAKMYLASLFYSGKGVEQDYKKAFDLYKISSENGHVQSQVQLGQFYLTGIGTEKNEEKAMYWFQKAADKGDALAQTFLGDYYRLKENYEKAFHWLSKASKQNNPDAMTSLAYMYLNGIFVSKDTNKALELYTQAAELGNEDAKKNLKILNNEQKKSSLFNEEIEKVELDHTNHQQKTGSFFSRLIGTIIFIFSMYMLFQMLH